MIVDDLDCLIGETGKNIGKLEVGSDSTGPPERTLDTGPFPAVVGGNGFGGLLDGAVSTDIEVGGDIGRCPDAEEGIKSDVDRSAGKVFVLSFLG